MDNNPLKNVFIKTGDSHGNDAKHHSLLDGVSRVVKNFAFASSFFLMGTVSDYSHAEEARDVPYTMNQPARSIFKCSQNSIEREAYFVANATTGDMILEHDGDVLIQPASMTKLMTLLLTHEAEKEGLDSDTTLYFSQSQKNARPYDDIFGHWGGAIRLGEAKKATAPSSYNDIAFLLAENVAKFKEVGNTETHFVRLMNQRAQELGMDNTFFYNSNGMPTPLVQSDRLGTTTRDMVTLYRHILLEEPDLVNIMGMRDTIVKSAKGRRKITNSNSFLRNDDVPFSGISGKTGATCQAGFAITMSASQDDETLIISYVGGKSWRDREERVSDILQEAFDEIKSQKEYQLIMELF